MRDKIIAGHIYLNSLLVSPAALDPSRRLHRLLSTSAVAENNFQIVVYSIDRLNAEEAYSRSSF